MRSFILTAALAAFAAIPAIAQVTTPPLLPANTVIDCSAFTKLPSGMWHLIKATTVSVAGTRVNFQAASIAPHRSFISDFDVYAVLEQKCSR